MDSPVADNPNATPATSATPKKPYQKPAFRHEQIFETMALAATLCHAETATPGCHLFALRC
jgi:hypothetical protein